MTGLPKAEERRYHISALSEQTPLVCDRSHDAAIEIHASETHALVRFAGREAKIGLMELCDLGVQSVRITAVVDQIVGGG